MSTPFIEMPQRAPASPWTTSEAAAAGRARRLARVAVDDDVPDMMFSARPVPALPRTRTVARLFIPAQ